MAISPRFAAVSAGDPELPHDSPGCFYSFDLDGNVLEMNAAMAGTLGYTREAAAFPAESLRDYKFWPHVSRVDNVFGDRNPICTCAGMEYYS